MPTWTRKDERQYEHIRQNALDRGRSEDRAEKIAARTVNKQRRQQGRTPVARSSGTGDPDASLGDRTKEELYDRARELHIDGRSHMSKDQLVDAIRSTNP